MDNSEKNIYILGIESSCDETSASVIHNHKMLSNVIAGQEVHYKYGGVVPELASRAHQQNIVPVIDTAIKEAGINKEQLSAIAFTRGPGLLGSLLVGVSFAKSLALGLGIPLLEVDHLQAHILAHFIKFGEDYRSPEFPFLCLTISGGHTQIVKVKSHFEMEIIGETIDDAAGETFDKVAKIMGLPYPGGPVIDKLAKDGDENAFNFPKPNIANLDFSFSGLKTSFLYFVRDHLKENENFIEEHKADMAASIQKVIIDILLDKITKAIDKTGIKTIAIAGGVSANRGLRARLKEESQKNRWQLFVPEFQFTTDNAAMIAIVGYYKFLRGEYADQSASPYARIKAR